MRSLIDAMSGEHAKTTSTTLRPKHHALYHTVRFLRIPNQILGVSELLGKSWPCLFNSVPVDTDSLYNSYIQANEDRITAVF